MKSLCIALLGCCLFVIVRSESEDDYYYDEDEYNYEQPQERSSGNTYFNYTKELPGVFQSECAYLPAEVVKTKDCSEITLNFNAQVELLLPVNITENKSIIVPFLVSQKQKATTFSHEAAKKLKLKDGENVTIVYESLPAIIGDENILGLDILKRCLLGIDLFNYEAGIVILSDRGIGYLVNWPIESFRDRKLQHKTRKYEAGFKNLIKKLETMDTKFEAEIKEYKKLLNFKDAQIKEAKAEIEALLQTYKTATGKDPIKPKVKPVRKGD